MDMALLRYGLNEVAEAARKNPRLINARQVKGLLKAVSEEGFRVGSALGFLARREGFDDIVERLREDKDVKAWMRGPAAGRGGIRLDAARVRRAMVAHSDCWRTSAREETLDSVGFGH